MTSGTNILCCFSSPSKPKRNSTTYSKKRLSNNTPYLQPNISTDTNKQTVKFKTLNDIPLTVTSPIIASDKSTPQSTNTSRQSLVTPSNEELDNLKLAMQKLWVLDTNRLKHGSDYDINIAYTTTTEMKLYRFMNEQKIYSNPTYKYFFDLINNPEDSPKETKEQFIKLIARTKIGKYLHLWLIAKRKCSTDPQSFITFLVEIWFSSNNLFKNLFIPNTQTKQGINNWLVLYNLEKNKKIKFEQTKKCEFLHHVMHNQTGKENFFSISVKYQNETIEKLTGFIGTSPEFEMCLYTMLYTGASFNNVDLCFNNVDARICVLRNSSAMDYAYIKFDYD